MIHILCACVCVSGGKEGGLDAAQRQVNDRGKCGQLLRGSCQASQGLSVTRDFGPLWFWGIAPILGACGEREVSVAPAGPCQGEGDTALLLRGSGLMVLAGTCQVKRSAKRRWWPAPCPPAHATPPCCGVTGRRRARLHQNSKTSAWSGSCWAAHAGSARAQNCGLQRPREGLWRCKPRCVCMHTPALECSPCHVHVKACAKMCASKARVCVRAPVPARVPACLCLLLCAVPPAALCTLEVSGACAWERRGEWGCGDITKTHAHPSRVRRRQASTLLSRNIWGTSGSHQRDSKISLEERERKKRE